MAKKPIIQEEPPVASTPATVTVKVKVSAVSEDGIYLKGETFETTAERAAALGDSVEIVLAD